MTNRFFNESFDAVRGTQARSPAIENNFAAVEDGFDAVQAELDTLTAGSGFLGSPDTPASFTGHALKLLRVNAAASAIEFVAPWIIGINTTGATSYTLVSTDAGSMVVFTSASAINVTVPADADVPLDVGVTVIICQLGTGQVTVSGAAGVSVVGTSGALSTRDQYSQITLIKIGADTWIVGGDRA